MNRFRRSGGGVFVQLDADEVQVLENLPALLNSVRSEDDDPAAARLTPSPYPDDSAANEEFRRLMTEELTEARAADRSAFLLSLEQSPDGVVLSIAEAEAWLKVLGEGRLVLAARMGIEQDGWEDRLDLRRPEVALMHYLASLQAQLVQVLSESLPA